MLSALVAFGARCLLVGLFLPFSALDKILNFKQAVAQASQAVLNRVVAKALIACGLGIEVVMSVAILTGVADRLKGTSSGRELFWDFMKNVALAGGFLTLAFGSDATGVQHFLHHPLQSSQPYVIAEAAHER